jgi:hypothetical protein
LEASGATMLLPHLLRLLHSGRIEEKRGSCLYMLATSMTFPALTLKSPRGAAGISIRCIVVVVEVLAKEAPTSAGALRWRRGRNVAGSAVTNAVIRLSRLFFDSGRTLQNEWRRELNHLDRIGGVIRMNRWRSTIACLRKRRRHN